MSSHSQRAKLGVLASGSGSNFEAIAAAIHDGRLNATISVLVCNNPDALAIARAQRLDIPAILINHRDYPSRQAFDQAVAQALQAHKADWIIMAGWMRIVTPTFLNHFPNRVLNIHPSLLPAFKGAHAIEDALRAGVKHTGCTVHYVIPELDAGPIIAQTQVPILEDDDLSALRARIQAAEHALYPHAISLATQGSA